MKQARTLTIGLVLAIAVAAAPAFAAGNSLHLSVPFVQKSTKHHPHPYTITVTGTTTGSKHLYLFIDSRTCGANPAVEFSRTGRTGTAFGYYIKSVTGSFSQSEPFSTIARITDHACAYLTKSTAKKNSAKGVVARAFMSYRVH